MQGEFRDCYSEQVRQQLSEGTPVDLNMSTMKPLGARWPISLYDYVTTNIFVVENDFKLLVYHLNRSLKLYTVMQC